MRFLRRLLTLRARRKRKLRFWYHPEYEPRLLAHAYPMIGLMPDRIDVMLGKLVSEKVIRRETVLPSPLATFDQLGLVHPESYVEAVTRPENLQRIFGIELNAAEVDNLLRFQRRAVGGTIAAAQAVTGSDVEVGFNLGGGFHHAATASGSGFCVFNDIAIAIRQLRADGYQEKIAIVDLDFHQGNGNHEIFAKDPSVLTYSLHGAVWDRSRAVSDLGLLLPPGTDDDTYLSLLRDSLLPALREHAPRLIFYIAGTDVLAGDRLGNFALSPRGVLRRDKHVLRSIDSLGDARLVVVLGGGYSPGGWQCTANLISHLRGREKLISKEMEPALRAKFTEIERSLESTDFSSEDLVPADLDISEEDILPDLNRLSPPQLLLDLYSQNGLEFAFEKYGILAKIRAHGFVNFRFDINARDREKQMLRLYAGKVSAPTEPVLLLEVVLRKLSLQAPGGAENDLLNFLDVNWLLIQDPLAEFVLGRPQLPGQEHPGLGIAEDIQEMLVQFCRRTRMDGVSGTPSHFHNGSVASRWFHFLDPLLEGRLLALRQVLIPYLLPDASRMVQEERLRLRNGSVVKWEPSLHVLPVSERMKAYFDSDEYRATAQRECQRLLLADLHLEGPPTHLKGLFSIFQDKPQQ